MPYASVILGNALFWLPALGLAETRFPSSIHPLSPVGISVLCVFLAGLLMIGFEVQLDMNKYKPALMMQGTLVLIGGHYYFSGDAPERFEPLHRLLDTTKGEVFSLVAFMAFMWMIVEILGERNVFGALNEFLLGKGLGAHGFFWAMGFLCAVLSPFVSSITTALIFGKSLQSVSMDRRYTHAMLCNIIIASNAGIWFVGVSTTLMVLLAHRVSFRDVILLIPASLIGWFAGALALDLFYLRRLDAAQLLRPIAPHEGVKPGGISLAIVSMLAMAGAVLLNMVFHVDLEFALGFGFALLSFHLWVLKKRGIKIHLHRQLQKVEFATLLYYIGILTGVAALNHVGWLTYLSWLFEHEDATWVNVFIGIVSCCVDNNVLEAAVLGAKPNIGIDQWALNMLLIAIGGSLTAVGSAPGVLAMTIDKSYTFGTHFQFLPAILINFISTLAIWYVQYQVLGWQ